MSKFSYTFDDLREHGKRLSDGLVLLELIKETEGSAAEGYLHEDKFGWYLSKDSNQFYDVYPGDVLLEVY